MKHKAEVISMVLTSFNQKAYEEDLKNQYKEGIEEGLILVVLKWLRKLPYVYSSPATPWSKLLS